MVGFDTSDSLRGEMIASAITIPNCALGCQAIGSADLEGSSAYGPPSYSFIFPSDGNESGKELVPNKG